MLTAERRDPQGDGGIVAGRFFHRPRKHPPQRSIPEASLRRLLDAETVQSPVDIRELLSINSLGSLRVY
jgi:hypothetical protein